MGRPESFKNCYELEPSEKLLSAAAAKKATITKNQKWVTRTEVVRGCFLIMAFAIYHT